MKIHVQSDSLFERSAIGVVKIKDVQYVGAPCPICMRFVLTNHRNVPCTHFAHQNATELVFLRPE